MGALFRSFVIAVVVALVAPAAAAAQGVRVVVELDAPGLARSVEASRVLTSAAKQRRLDVASNEPYLRALAARQGAFPASSGWKACAPSTARRPTTGSSTAAPASSARRSCGTTRSLRLAATG